MAESCVGWNGCIIQNTYIISVIFYHIILKIIISLCTLLDSERTETAVWTLPAGRRTTRAAAVATERLQQRLSVGRQGGEHSREPPPRRQQHRRRPECRVAAMALSRRPRGINISIQKYHKINQGREIFTIVVFEKTINKHQTVFGGGGETRTHRGVILITTTTTAAAIYANDRYYNDSDSNILLWRLFRVDRGDGDVTNLFRDDRVFRDDDDVVRQRWVGRTDGRVGGGSRRRRLRRRDFSVRGLVWVCATEMGFAGRPRRSIDKPPSPPYNPVFPYTCTCVGNHFPNAAARRPSAGHVIVRPDASPPAHQTRRAV